MLFSKKKLKVLETAVDDLWQQRDWSIDIDTFSNIFDVKFRDGQFTRNLFLGIYLGFLVFMGIFKMI